MVAVHMCHGLVNFVCVCVCLSLCVSITLSVNSPTGQTPQRIFTVDSLKDADGRHFENRYIATSQWKIIRFLWRNQKMKKLHWTDSEFDRTYFFF